VGQRQRLDGVEGIGDTPFSVDDIQDLAREVRSRERFRDRQRCDVAARR